VAKEKNKLNDAKQEFYCQWFTPYDFSQSFLRWANIGDGDTIIEPAAGEGALVPDRPGVLAIEIDPELIDELRYWRPEATIVNANFLEMEPPSSPVFDVCTQNPPFARICEDGEGVFIERSLRWAHRTCAIIRTAGLHGKGRFEKCWRFVRPTRIALLRDRPKYLGPGGRPTDMNPMTEFCAVECVLRDEPLPLDAFEDYEIECKIQWVDW
jgi:hypothetical protein